MVYSVTQIGTEESERILSSMGGRRFTVSKADISGICVALYTEDREFTEMWRDNFSPMDDHVRYHARLVCVEDPDGPRVLYDRSTFTAILYGFTYYGWVKSIALAVASDLLEDAHGTFHVHGAALDIDGTGVTLIAPSKTGKTTQSWGLLRKENSRLITDDWYFVKLSDGRPSVSGSEKNCYIDADIGDVWEEYRPLVKYTRFDSSGRGIANVRWAAGEDSVISGTYMRYVILLKRDNSDPRLSFEMDTDEAVEYLAANDFCNPHQMVRSERKVELRKRFFREYLSRCKVFMVNTVTKAETTQETIRGLIL